MTGVGAATSLDLGGRSFDIEFRAVVFGVLDTAAHRSTRELLRRAEQLVDEGADVLDLGEGTPNDLPLAEGREYERVAVATRALAGRFDAPLAIVTREPLAVLRGALMGASVASDRTGGSDPEFLALVAEFRVAIVVTAPSVGRGLGKPGSADAAERLLELPRTMRAFLAERAARAEAAGVPRHRILLDIGVDANAPIAETRLLLRGCSELVELGYPLVLSTVSRPALPGGGSPAPWPLTAAQAFAIGAGCRVLRTTDVRAGRRVADVMAEILAARREEPL